ncbi:hypothetical protein HPB47_006642, partial [Ixodes persulcatus]
TRKNDDDDAFGRTIVLIAPEKSLRTGRKSSEHLPLVLPRSVPTLRGSTDMSHHEAPKPASADVECGEPAIIDDDASTTDESDNGGKWTTQMTKKRRHGSNSSQSTIISQPIPNLTVIVKPTDPTNFVTNLNPLVLKKKLEDVAPDSIIQIRPNYRLNLLALDTRNVESTKALLRLKSL